MDFVLTCGQDFVEHFDFKDANGRSLVMPFGTYRLVLERGLFAREYTLGRGLTRTRNQLIWKITAAQTKDFEYATMYYTLYLDNTELARGILRVR